MSHYFINDKDLKDDLKKLDFSFHGNQFAFLSNSGMFSKDHVDPASIELIETVPPLSGSLLDMGCGYGCIGIALAKAYGLKLTQADINEAALALAEKNCQTNGVKSELIKSDCFESVSGLFDTIAINPPIHAGKSVTYKMYEDSVKHLVPGGKLYVVTFKKHGAESTKEKLAQVYGNCETLRKKKGCYVFCCEKEGLQ
ncbi:MAG: methyltransferase [Clostridiales bacterium]|jgi:16S rRNA (guanine1207-N2)-methyltransferase|nr:methyltransferase [Clostridiales bacterium]